MSWSCGLQRITSSRPPWQECGPSLSRKPVNSAAAPGGRMKVLWGPLSLLLCVACAHRIEVFGASPGCGGAGPPTTEAALRDCLKLVGFDTLEAAGDKQ